MNEVGSRVISEGKKMFLLDPGNIYQFIKKKEAFYYISKKRIRIKNRMDQPVFEKRNMKFSSHFR